jgi:hypothetical protein
MAYTVRPTWPDQPRRTDDYVFRYNGVDVGRTYGDRFAGNVLAWRWTIYLGRHVRRTVDGVSVTGLADTPEEAKAQFRASFEKMIAAGVVDFT